MKIHILSSNLIEARRCASDNNLQPSDWVFLDEPCRLRGLSKVIVWLYNGYSNRRDLGEIFFFLHDRKTTYVTKSLPVKL